jgi:hypothetical protein
VVANETVSTLREAFGAVRTLKARNDGSLPSENGSVVIELAPGRHFQDEPLVITPDDVAGSAYTCVVAEDDGRPQPRPSIVSGGRRIVGWKAAKWNGKDAWCADVAESRGGGWPFRELFVNGERRTRARHPSRGYLAVAGLTPTDAPKPWNEGVASFRLSPSDAAVLRGAGGRGDGTLADVTVMCRWVESHARVKSIDFDQGVVELREPTVFKLDPGDPLYFDGAAACLDEPGEWWLDEKEGRVWYLPLATESLDHVEIFAPKLQRLISIEGDLAHHRFVERMIVRQVDFEHCGWWFPPNGDAAAPRASGFPQAAVGVPAAIEVVGGRDLDFDTCRVAHVGGYALSFGAGCRDVHVTRCALHDLGAGGVKIGETVVRDDVELRASDVEVTSCDVHDGGRIFHSAVGVWVGQSPKTTIQSTEISDFYYTGISLGWTWGYDLKMPVAHKVVANDVHHVGQRSDGDGPILSDMGGIYTLGPQPGTVIEDNRFADVAALRYGGWGIYFDEGSTGITARRNLVTRTTHGGFHQHYGKDNVVEENVFAYGRDAQIQRSRCEPHTSFTFRRNVVLFDHGELFAGDLSDGHFVFDDNLYWREDGHEILFAGKSLEPWRAAGFDRASRVVAPGFVDAKRDDFELVEGAAAKELLLNFGRVWRLAHPIHLHQR